jgi:hypothetical protein
MVEVILFIMPLMLAWQTRPQHILASAEKEVLEDIIMLIVQLM